MFRNIMSQKKKNSRKILKKIEICFIFFIHAAASGVFLGSKSMCAGFRDSYTDNNSKYAYC